MKIAAEQLLNAILKHIAWFPVHFQEKSKNILYWRITEYPVFSRSKSQPAPFSLAFKESHVSLNQSPAQSPRGLLVMMENSSSFSFRTLYLICVEPNCLIGFSAYCLSPEAVFYLLLVLSMCTFTCTSTLPSSLTTKHKSYQSLFLEFMVLESPSSRREPFIPPGL